MALVLTIAVVATTVEILRRPTAAALYQKGLQQYRGQGVPRNYGRAMAWWRKAAAASSAAAMDQIAGLYVHGKGVSVDQRQARKWYRKAARAGSTKAMYQLGQLYSHGQGVEVNPVVAARWYRQAAQAGSALAMDKLGILYITGVGLTKNYGLARYWLGKAVMAGSVPAIVDMGKLYQHGDGVKKDYHTAMVIIDKPPPKVMARPWMRLAGCTPKVAACHGITRRWWPGIVGLPPQDRAAPFTIWECATTKAGVLNQAFVRRWPTLKMPQPRVLRLRCADSVWPTNKARASGPIIPRR